jgi:uncharacterized membrane protein required for colicin V production
MLMAALPAFSFNYVDGVVAVWLIVGIFRGRKRGMSQELLPAMQWVAIIILAGLFYLFVSAAIFRITSGSYNQLWSNVTGYILIGFAINLVFIWIKQMVGEKLVGSDSFGRAEYYLGMMAGLLRFACMFIALCALMNSHIYTAAELAEDEKTQRRNFEDIRFPTYGSIQHSVLKESYSGQFVVATLSRILIASTSSGSKTAETPAQKREDTINMILGAPPK